MFRRRITLAVSLALFVMASVPILAGANPSKYDPSQKIFENHSNHCVTLKITPVTHFVNGREEKFWHGAPTTSYSLPARSLRAWTFAAGTHTTEVFMHSTADCSSPVTKMIGAVNLNFSNSEFQPREIVTEDGRMATQNARGLIFWP